MQTAESKMMSLTLVDVLPAVQSEQSPFRLLNEELDDLRIHGRLECEITEELQSPVGTRAKVERANITFGPSGRVVEGVIKWSSEFEEVAAEGAILSEFSHVPNMLKAFFLVQDPCTSAFGVVLQYCGHLDAKQYIGNLWRRDAYSSAGVSGKRYRMQAAVAIAHDLLLALSEMHAEGYVHCDVKPDNVYISSLRMTEHGLELPIAVLADVAGAKCQKHFQSTSFCLTLTDPYTAPELAYMLTLAGIGGSSKGYFIAASRLLATPKADVWAAGVTLLELLTCKHLFARGDIMATFEAILDDSLDWESLTKSLTGEKDVPEAAGLIPLLQGMLHPDANMRPTAAQASQALESFTAGRPMDLSPGKNGHKIDVDAALGLVVMPSDKCKVLLQQEGLEGGHMVDALAFHRSVQEVIADTSVMSGCASAAGPRLRDLDLTDSIDYLLFLMRLPKVELSDGNWEDLYCAFKTVEGKPFQDSLQKVPGVMELFQLTLDHLEAKKKAARTAALKAKILRLTIVCQTRARGFLARKSFREQLQSALDVQRAWRKVLESRGLVAHNAATCIQKCFRGYSVRKQMEQQRAAAVTIQAYARAWMQLRKCRKHEPSLPHVESPVAVLRDPKQAVKQRLHGDLGEDLHHDGLDVEGQDTWTLGVAVDSCMHLADERSCKKDVAEALSSNSSDSRLSFIHQVKHRKQVLVRHAKGVASKFIGLFKPCVRPTVLHGGC